MAEPGLRRSPAKRVSRETGIEGSNPSLSAMFYCLVKKHGEISYSADGGEAEPPESRQKHSALLCIMMLL